MGYSVIKAFDRGIDRRRMIDTTEMGGLLDAKDCHITRGGEIEKRAAFVNIGTFPTNSKGFFSTRTEQFHVWGSDASPVGTLPPDTSYHSIPAPSGSPLNSILCVEEFSGKLYVIALYDDMTILHWWDDPPAIIKVYVPPPTPPSGGTGGGPPDPVIPPTVGLQPGMPRATFMLNTLWGWTDTYHPEKPSHVVTAIMFPPGTDWKFDSTYAPGAFTIVPTNAVYDDGTENNWPYNTTPTPIPFDISGNGIAAAIANAINAFVSTPKFNAVVTGNLVTVYVSEVTAFYNGWRLAIIPTAPPETLNADFPSTTISDATTDAYANPTFNGGLAATPPGLMRVVDSTPAPRVAGDTAPMQLGTFVLAHGQKMYATKDSELWISMDKNCTIWSELVFGSDTIDFTMESEGKPTLVSLADYGNDLAIFATRHIFLWHMDPDPKQNFRKQVLHRTGTIAPHSTCAYSESEVMYLDRSGIRSLRSRASTDAVFAGDVGNLIDDLVQETVEPLTLVELANNVWCDVEPRSGRLWMAIKDKIFVLSYFPSGQIAGWTVYDASANPVDVLCPSGDNMFIRSGNNFICYGNRTGDQYDATQAYARLPYLNGDKPATHKNWTGVDLAAIGTWSVEASFDTTMPTALDLIANITKSTYAQQHLAMNGNSPSVSLLLKTSYVGPARIGNAAIHYSDSISD